MASNQSLLDRYASTLDAIYQDALKRSLDNTETTPVREYALTLVSQISRVLK